jgi:hypothetical protein
MSFPWNLTGVGRDHQPSTRQIVVMQLDSNGDIAFGVFDEVETAMFAASPPPVEVIVCTDHTATVDRSTPEKTSI